MNNPDAGSPGQENIAVDPSRSTSKLYDGGSYRYSNASARFVGFLVRGSIDVFLNGGVLDRPEEGLSGWLAHALETFKKKEEDMSYSEFAIKIKDFCEDVGLNDIIVAEIDHSRIFQADESKDHSNLSEGINTMRDHLDNISDCHQVTLYLHAEEDDFMLAVEIKYRKKHAIGEPAINLIVAGIPRPLMLKDEESKADFEDRLLVLGKQFEIDQTYVDNFLRSQEGNLGKIVDKYSTAISAKFSVEDVESEVFSSSI